MKNEIFLVKSNTQMLKVLLQGSPNMDVYKINQPVLMSDRRKIRPHQVSTATAAAL